MERREAFKKMGLLGLVGLSGMALVSCGNTPKTKIEKAAPLAAAVIPKAKSERELLIIDRNHHKIADPAKPTKAELKHTPDISFGEKDEKGNTLVKITVGKEGIIHPATKEHWVDYLNVYVNNRLVSKTEFSNGGIRGYGYYFLDLKKGDIVKAEAACNLHGIWDSSLTL